MGDKKKHKRDKKRRRHRSRSRSQDSSDRKDRRSRSSHRSRDEKKNNHKKESTHSTSDNKDKGKEEKKEEIVKKSNFDDKLDAINDETIPFQKISHTDIQNHKRKLVVTNLPPKISNEDIINFFGTIITSLKTSAKNTKSSIVSVEQKLEGAICILEFNSKEDAELCLNLDGVDWQGYKLKMQRTKRFFTEYNETEGKNLRKAQHSFQKMTAASDNKIYMGGIPAHLKEDEIKKICEAFGMLKSFNLVKDPANLDLNKGFAFFEYADDRVADRAIKMLNNLDIGDRKLKVQRASTGQKQTQVAPPKPQVPMGYSSSVPTDLQINIPLFAMTPSRVVQFLNMVMPEDLFDDEEVKLLHEDVMSECQNYGEVIKIEIARPDKKTGIMNASVGKVFVKFNHIVAAKQSRYRLAGRKYNGRTVVSSFYPEHYFDIKDFNCI